MEISQKTIYRLVKEMSGQANVLTIPRVFIDLTGDHVSALLLSQAIYWSERTDDPDGWFYKSHADWRVELGLSPYQVRNATEKLGRFGLVTDLRQITTKTGKAAPVLHYRVDQSLLTQALLTLLETKENPDDPASSPDNGGGEGHEAVSKPTVEQARKRPAISYSTELGQPDPAKPQPAPKPAKPSKPPAPLMDCPAVVIYRDECRVTPNETARQEIADQVKDLEVWRKVVRGWVASQYNRRNVAGMLERYSQAVDQAANQSRQARVPYGQAQSRGLGQGWVPAQAQRDPGFPSNCPSIEDYRGQDGKVNELAYKRDRLAYFESRQPGSRYNETLRSQIRALELAGQQQPTGPIA